MSPTTNDRDEYEERQRRVEGESGEEYTGNFAGWVIPLAVVGLIVLCIVLLLLIL